MVKGTSDGFQFVYQGLAGDGEITARVTTMTNTSTWAKAGIMIRESLAANAAHVMLDIKPNNELDFITRPSTGADTTWLAGATQPLPAWLRLSRAGTTVTAFVSADGATWRLVGTTTLSIAANAVVGLVVHSHNIAALNTSTFDNVTVVAGAPNMPPAPPSAPTPLDGATAVSSTPTLPGPPPTNDTTIVRK